MSNWKRTLGAIAPTLATALGGPLAGAAIGVISQALLGKDGATPKEIAVAIGAATPEQLVKLQSADQEFQLRTKELDIMDRSSARKLAIDTTIVPQVTLSSIYTIGYFWLMAMLISGDVKIPEDISGMVMALIGVMTAAQAQIMNFWFGSSSGSKDKTKRLQGGI